jgi:hypothetical protein
MMPPIDIVIERMRMYDVVEVIELLKISAEDIIDRFADRITEREEYLRREFEIFNNTDDDELDLDEPEVFPIEEEEDET